MEGRKSYATQETYEGYLKKWILPRWRSYRLGDVKTVQVEQWLHSVPLAQGSRAKIRNIMSALYSHAIRWEWTKHNPITAVRQSAKRSKVPIILTIEQIQALLPHLEEPCARGFAGCGHRVESRRTAGSQVGRRRFREAGDQRDPLCGQAEDRALQDGGLAQAHTARRRTSRAVVELEAQGSLQPAGRLDLRQPAQAWQAAVTGPAHCSGSN